MNDVVSGAPRPQSVLVTGFGPFPGAPKNPTATIVAALDGMRPRFEALGIDLSTSVLPVVYAEMDSVLRDAIDGRRLDAILHLGVATRREQICVEACARNKVGAMRPDAAGARPPSSTLLPAGPATLATTYAAQTIVAAIRRLGHPARVSRDAGDYLCNALLYRSLHTQAAPQVGFIHVPLPTDFWPEAGRVGLSIADLTNAVLAAVLIMAAPPVKARRWASPKARTTGAAPEGP